MYLYVNQSKHSSQKLFHEILTCPILPQLLLLLQMVQVLVYDIWVENQVLVNNFNLTAKFTTIQYNTIQYNRIELKLLECTDGYNYRQSKQ